MRPCAVNPASFCRKAMPWVVWTLRIVVGAVFIISGIVKAIDVWGTVFKFEEYFALWHLAVPYELDVVLAMGLSSAEFILGIMLATGCYRRVSVWLLLLMMAVMLPLTCYIWIADPVADCGCFGDFWKISNGATFFKNIVITAALVFLAVANRHAGCIINPYLQWIAGVACLVFSTGVELYGLTIQPLADFRSFPEGRSLVADDEADFDDADFIFTYEKAGEKRDFTSDSLPDSTWTFVDRKAIGEPLESNSLTQLTIYDEDDADVTSEAISSDGPEILIVVPESSGARLNIATVAVALDSAMSRVGGTAILVSDLSDSRIKSLRDVFAPGLPVYRAESTTLKELSRGAESVVLLIDGNIVLKRNLETVDVENLVSSPNPVATLSALKPLGASALRVWSLILAGVLFVLSVVSKIISLLNNPKKDGGAGNNSVPLHGNEQSAADNSASPESDTSLTGNSD